MLSCMVYRRVSGIEYASTRANCELEPLPRTTLLPYPLTSGSRPEYFVHIARLWPESTSDADSIRVRDKKRRGSMSVTDTSRSFTKSAFSRYIVCVIGDVSPVGLPML